MPRRSGTTTVWSFASSAAIGDHMSPVSPKPWISTTAGPWPPTRTLIVASAFITCELRKSAGKGCTSSTPGLCQKPHQLGVDLLRMGPQHAMGAAIELHEPGILDHLRLPSG